MPKVSQNVPVAVCYSALDYIASFYDVSPSKLKALVVSEPRDVRWAKRALTFLLWDVCKVPQAQIAEFLGWQHGSINVVVKEIRQQIARSPAIRSEIETIKKGFRTRTKKLEAK